MKISSQTESAGIAFVASFDLKANPAAFSFDWTVSFEPAPAPDVLTFDPVTKTIKGTPTYARTYNLIFTATAPKEAGGLTLSKEINMTVGSAVVEVKRSNLTTNSGGTAGVPFEGTFDFAAEPSVYTYIWNVTGQPSTLSYSGGKLTGTPLELGTYTLTATAPSYAGETPGTRTLTLTIAPAVLSTTFDEDVVKKADIGTP